MARAHSSIIEIDSVDEGTQHNHLHANMGDLSGSEIHQAVQMLRIIAEPLLPSLVQRLLPTLSAATVPKTRPF